jgi:hypothetical protein
MVGVSGVSSSSIGGKLSGSAAGTSGIAVRTASTFAA